MKTCCHIDIVSRPNDSPTFHPCGFIFDDDGLFCEFENNIYCIFHAPKQAIIQDTGETKEDFFSRIREDEIKLLNISNLDQRPLLKFGTPTRYIFQKCTILWSVIFNPSDQFFHLEIDNSYFLTDVVINFKSDPDKIAIGIVNISKNIFNDHVSLNLRKVTATLEGNIFHKPLSIRDSEFRSFYFMDNTADNINISKTKFDLASYFNRSTIKSLILGDIDGNTQFGNLEFNLCHIGLTTSNNVKFFGSAKFNSKFYIAPNFIGSTFLGGVDFSGSEFLDKSSTFAESSYRDLKLKMEQARNRHWEGYFHALEYQTIANTKLSKFEKFLSNSYKITSDYGQSPTLSALYLAYTIVIPSFLYFLIRDIHYSSFSQDATCITSYFSSISQAIAQSIETSITSSLKPFFLLGTKENLQKCIDPISEPSFLVKIISSIQGLLILTIFALFLLSVRWKFKRD